MVTAISYYAVCYTNSFSQKLPWPPVSGKTLCPSSGSGYNSEGGGVRLRWTYLSPRHSEIAYSGSAHLFPWARWDWDGMGKPTYRGFWLILPPGNGAEHMETEKDKETVTEKNNNKKELD